MSIIDKFLDLLAEFAYSRQKFIDDVRTALKGAIGEYLCRQIALSVGKPDSWTGEIEDILNQIPKLMNTQITSTTFKNRSKALGEAMTEASLNSATKLVYAKNKVTGYYPECMHEIRDLKISASHEFEKMIREFLPQYAYLLNGGR